MHLLRSCLAVLLWAPWCALQAAEGPPPSRAIAIPSRAHLNLVAEATKIDALVTAGLRKHGLKPNPDIDDPAFVRRVYLDVMGRIPTLKEVAVFFDNPSPTRRQMLIQRLLVSEGAVSREFNWWADLLRVMSQPMKNYPGEPYSDWLKGAIRADMPYDQLVSALLTSHGHVMERGNGATGYYIRDAGMPQDNMSCTVQVFLGTRIACAQCHDHPFDKWTRLQYMQMSAYTANVSESPDQALIKILRGMANPDAKPNALEQQGLNRLGQTILLEVRSPPKDTTSLPKDYQYPNGKAGQTIKAHVMFGPDATPAPGQDPRIAFASWLTSPDNPRFTTVIANRRWKKVMGFGLIEPVDNMTDATLASDPDLMDHLTALMKDVEYDLRAFDGILFSTKAYQRAATTTDVNAGDGYYFPGPVQRRLTAEQAWDSLMTLIIPDVDERKNQGAEALYAAYEDMKEKTPKELWGIIENLVDAITKRQEVQDKLKETLAKFSDKNEANKDPEIRELRKQLQGLNDEANGLGYVRKPPMPENDPRWKGYARDLMRASELPSPAPPGHFLRDFGQSDRQLIDNANASPAVPQALTLLNGIVDQRVLKPDSVLMVALDRASGQEQKIRTAYTMILCRQPSDHELARFMASGGGKPQAMPQVISDVVWTLINSREFIFQK